MDSGLPEDLGAKSDPKLIQEYIDETPVWRDGTILQMTPITGMSGFFGCEPKLLTH